MFEYASLYPHVPVNPKKLATLLKLSLQKIQYILYVWTLFGTWLHTNCSHGKHKI